MSDRSGAAGGAAVDALGDWILGVSVSEAREAEREPVLDRLRDLAGQTPDADHWYLVGYAIYHLWQPPLAPALTAEALIALNRALRLDPQHEWSRIHKMYLAFDHGDLVSALADARTLDRDFFAGSPVEWRVISADEIEFACLVRLGIRDEARLTELFDRIVHLATPGPDDFFPFTPSIFFRAFEEACTAGYYTPPTADALRTVVAQLEAQVKE